MFQLKKMHFDFMFTVLSQLSTLCEGHITTVGLGTYVDPTPGVGCGGAANELAMNSPLNRELVTKISMDNTDYLMYKALPINVAIIRATTADSAGNLSFEHESLLRALKDMRELKAEQMLTILTAAETEMYESSKKQEEQ